MTEYKLLPFQEKAFNEIIEKFDSGIKRLMLQAQTGYGKTYTFSFIAKHFVDKGEKVVVLCHREELINQTCETLHSIGVTYQKVLPSTKNINGIVDVYVCMVETVFNRLKKNRFKFDNVGLLISDESHIRVYEKVYDYFKESKILAVSATPVSTKREKFFRCKYCKSESTHLDDCCGEEMDEWSKPFTFSQVYEDIVVGANVDELIEYGQLVKEISFVKKYADLSGLKVDGTGEYTTQSLDEAYVNDDSAFNCLLNYKELCKGKRTIIFNTSAKHNLLIYEKFKEEGLNVRMFDSVNSEISGNRKELIEWFKTNDDAILLNVNVFTAGFDCKEVEAIIINRATKSEALFLQMVGRGGRSSNKIFKDSFILIDGGDNISEFGEWSDPNRDWRKIFFEGKGKEKPKRMDVEDVQDCPECGALFPKKELKCTFCGHELEKIDMSSMPNKENIESEDVLTPIRKIPPPSGIHIYNYTKQMNENIHFSFRILQSRIVDMFKYWRVTKPKYLSAKQKGELDRKIKKHILKPYFYLIKQPDIQNGTHRTIEYLINKTKDKLERYYNEK